MFFFQLNELHFNGEIKRKLGSYFKNLPTNLRPKVAKQVASFLTDFKVLTLSNQVAYKN